MAISRFSPDALPTMRAFADRAVSRPFSEQKAAAMHTQLVLSLGPEEFTALYEDMAQAEIVDDLSTTSRKLLRQALVELDAKAWTPEQERLHPRGQHGRFASKPGIGDLESAVADVGQLIDGVMQTAKKNEPQLSATMKDLAKGVGGQLVGYKRRLKTRESIDSKLKRMQQEQPGMDAARAAREISDSVRYTLVFPSDENHAQSVQAAVAKLEGQGYQVAKLKNYWEVGDPYNGINGVFVHPDTGFRFEVQFHTPDSWQQKNQIHLLYNQFREPDTSRPERQRLYDQMVRATDGLQRPPGVLDIGTAHQITPEGASIRTEQIAAASLADEGSGKLGTPGTQIANPDSKDAVDVGGDVERAVQLLAEGKAVNFEQPRHIAVLLDKLADIVKEANAKGEKAPKYNLCNVTVKKTSLFCVKSKGVSRLKMPQLKGVPLAGSKADALPKNDKGEVDLTDAFVQYLQDMGATIEDGTEQAAYLHASQNELNGAKVAGISKYLQGGGKIPGQMLVSKDNYVIDGHHRWAAQVGADAAKGDPAEADPMPVRRVNMDILRLLYHANNFTHDMGIPSAGFSGEGAAAAKPNEPKPKTGKAGEEATVGVTPFPGRKGQGGQVLRDRAGQEVRGRPRRGGDTP